MWTHFNDLCNPSNEDRRINCSVYIACTTDLIDFVTKVFKVNYLILTSAYLDMKDVHAIGSDAYEDFAITQLIMVLKELGK